MILTFTPIASCWEDVDSTESKCSLSALKRGTMFFASISVIKTSFFFYMMFRAAKNILFYYFIGINGEFQRSLVY